MARTLMCSGVLAVLLACGGARGRSQQAIYPTILSNLDGDACRVASYPPQLPVVARIIDSAKLSQLVARPPGMPTGEAVVAVRFGPDGEPERVAALAGPQDSIVRRGIESAVRSALVVQAPAPVWGVRLRVISANRITVSLEPSQYCPPAPIRTGPALAVAQTPMTLSDLAELRSAGPFRFRVLVNTSGRVVRAEMTQTSGSSFQDRFALDNARKMTYAPGRLDGDPIVAWLEVSSLRQ
jgi:hypothetical protein